MHLWKGHESEVYTVHEGDVEHVELWALEFVGAVEDANSHYYKYSFPVRITFGCDYSHLKVAPKRLLGATSRTQNSIKRWKIFANFFEFGCD